MIKSKNIIYENKEQLIDALEHISLRKPNKALVQVFSGVMNLDLIHDIIDIFNDHLPGTPLIGVTTDGEVINGISTEYNIVINITSFQKTNVKSLLIEGRDDLSRAGEKIIETLGDENTKAIILFGSGQKTGFIDEDTKLVHIIQEKLPQAVISGGQAVNSCKSDSNYVFTEKGITNNGFVAASLDSATLNVLSTYNLNWSPIGHTMTITDVNGKCVKEIDGKTPYDIYSYHLGNNVVAPSSGLSKDFPLMVKRDGILQALHVTSMNHDGSFNFDQSLAVGEKVQFGYCHAVLFSDSGDNICYALAGEGMEVAFVYASASRKKLLGSIMDTELYPLKSLHCSVGFFGEGVYYHEDPGTNVFFKDAMTILALTEGFSFEQGDKSDRECGKEVSRQSMIMRALHRLIETSTLEIK